MPNIELILTLVGIVIASIIMFYILMFFKYRKALRYKLYAEHHAPELITTDDINNTTIIPINHNMNIKLKHDNVKVIHVHGGSPHLINISLIIDDVIMDTACIPYNDIITLTLKDVILFKHPYNKITDPIINHYYKKNKD